MNYNNVKILSKYLFSLENVVQLSYIVTDLLLYLCRHNNYYSIQV